MAAMATSGEKASYEESRDDLDPVLLPGRFVFVDEAGLVCFRGEAGEYRLAPTARVERVVEGWRR